MTDIILHHYDVSPFAEKIRAALAYKGVPWRSVEIPVVMPKPDLVALTGGYRKTPVLQIGCDVYCDTLRIARVLDELVPERPLFRPELAAVEVPAGRWLDQHLFFAAIVRAFFEPDAAAAAASGLGGPEAMAAFAKDRAEMMKEARVRPPRPGEARAILAEVLGRLEAQLAAQGPWLFGERASWVDFCAYHPLLPVSTSAAVAAELEPYPQVRTWIERIRVLPREAKPLDAREALAIARGSEPRALPEAEGPPFDALAVGDPVRVAADDYGSEPTRGRLVYVGPDALALRRTDERAGEVTVHFPRLGFRVQRDEAQG